MVSIILINIHTATLVQFTAEKTLLIVYISKWKKTKTIEQKYSNHIISNENVYVVAWSKGITNHRSTVP
jgi:hypothetical protein